MIAKRVKLGEVLPLKTPYTLQIFPTFYCNFKCKYCLHGLPEKQLLKDKNYGQVMDFSVFKKIVDDAKNFNEKLKTIIFSGLGEPLMHPRIVDMVAYAQSSNVTERTKIVTNGALLTHEISDALISANLKELKVSIQGTDSECYQNLCGSTINFQKFVENISYFYKNKKDTNVHIKIIDTALKDVNDKTKFYEIFSPIADDITVEHMVALTSKINYSEVGDLSESFIYNSKCVSKICSFPFYMMEIYPDGTVGPCCNFDNSPILGNIKRESLTDIWNGNVHRNLMKNLLDGTDKTEICANCLTYNHILNDSDRLDEYADQIKPLLNNK